LIYGLKQKSRRPYRDDGSRYHSTSPQGRAQRCHDELPISNDSANGEKPFPSTTEPMERRDDTGDENPSCACGSARYTVRVRGKCSGASSSVPAAASHLPAAFWSRGPKYCSPSTQYGKWLNQMLTHLW